HSYEQAGITEVDGGAGGTVSYLAPERGSDLALDGRTDVYSLVLTLVESVTGRVPLSGGTPSEVMLRRRELDVEVPDEMGAAHDIISRGGRSVVEERPFAIEFRDGLVESTRSFTTPARLPLVGALPDGAPAYGGGEPTLVPATPLALPPEVDASIGSDVETAPRPRWKPTKGLAALVTLVLGALAAGAAWMVSDVDPPRTPTHVVADYTGLSIGDVRALAETNEWVLDEDQVRSDDVEAGVVLSQRPGSGFELAEGKLLAVEVASGPYLRMTPTVVGLTKDGAVARLEARGFEIDLFSPRFDEVIPADVVMELLVDGDSVHGGTLREPGERVSLVVSSGPVPRTVPRLVDMTVEDATVALTAIQLTLAEEPEREFSETVLEGVVLSQDLAPGIQVDRDSSVIVVVSKGPDRREVPNLIGLSIAEATRRLEEIGLTRSGVSGGGDVVDATEPAAGTLLPPGSEVLLWAPTT
ncbi:MAG: PASTA domain-containing protein, partial [Actinomycetota bacterium]|nr:PASTA domain-containing protein [Actinomycetota bacterium]